MPSGDKKDCQLSVEKARFSLFFERWRAQLLIDESEGSVDQIEFDRRMLDYYLDQYNELATFLRRFPRQELSQQHRRVHSWQPEHTGQIDNALPFSALAP